MLIAIFGLVLSCTHGNRPGDCAVGKCTILEGRYCSECATPGEVPINGICIPYNDSKTVASGCASELDKSLKAFAMTCSLCTKMNYFIHEGGCYNILYSPGNLICVNAVENICDTCSLGYYLETQIFPPTCKACHAHCRSCTGDAEDQCLSCYSDRFLVKHTCIECSDSQQGISDCHSCTIDIDGFVQCISCYEKYYLSGNQCLPCSNNCATCTGMAPNKCLSCIDNYSYDSKAHTCVLTCDKSKLAQSGKCTEDGCNAFGSKFCVKCSLGTEIPINGICTPNDQNICLHIPNSSGVCDSCAKGYILFQGGCYQMDSELGIKACAHSISIRDMTFCAVCGTSGFVPIDGICISYNSPLVIKYGCRYLNGGFPTSVSTKCASCGSGYFYYQNGCYSTESAPGNVVCVEADKAGRCKECAEYYFRSKGDCVPCHSTCISCLGPAENDCTSCTPELFFQVFAMGKGMCKRCNDVTLQYDNTGIDHCAKCLPLPRGQRAQCIACENGYLLLENRCELSCWTDSSLPRPCLSGHCNVFSSALCSRCADKNECPINGQCTSTLIGVKMTSGYCTECPPRYFIYEGGCYEKGTLPGLSICKDTDDTNICSVCASGYTHVGLECRPCSIEYCQSCDRGVDTCDTCAYSYKLQHNKGIDSCVKVCKEGLTSGSCIYGGCVVYDKTFCGRCSVENEIPVDGICQAPQENSPECILVEGGKCKKCSKGHLLYYGGCYNTAKLVIPICEKDNIVTGYGITYCKKCTVETEYPINGSCNNELSGNTCERGECTSCGIGYFLHRTVCFTPEFYPEVCIKAGAGICEICGPNHYLNPIRSSTIQSCIHCRDINGVFGYTGVAFCKSCLAPLVPGTAKCVSCIDRYLLINGVCVETCPLPSDPAQPISGQCSVGFCDILGATFCSKCALDTDVLIDGKCNSVDKDNVCKRSNIPNGTCVGCAKQFFHYKNGCYNPKTYPGNAICGEYAVIDDTIYCFRCNTLSDLLINGQCISTSDSKPPSCILARVPNGKCYYCIDNYFLLRGSCVSATTAPGNIICQDLGAQDGICETCKDGYYAPPDRSSVSDSCIACTEGSSTLKGIPHCKSCATSSGSLVCTACDKFYRPMNEGSECVQTCIEEEASSSSNERKCKTGKCDVMGTFYCSQCATDTEAPINGLCAPLNESICAPHETKNGTCRYCARGHIMYRGGCYRIGSVEATDICDAQDVVTTGAGSFCIRCKQTDEVPIDGECKASTDECTVKDNGACKSCRVGLKSFQVTLSGASTTVACFANCPDGTYESNAICQTCSANCRTCQDTATKCTACPDGFYLASDRCVSCTAAHCLKCSAASTCTSCQDGYYLSGGSCTACTSGCRTCDSTKCTVCNERYELSNNACTETCPIGMLLTSCKDGYCNVNGTLACSRCAFASSVIIDGKCVATNTDSVCIRTTPPSGTCAACKDTHILYYGGCYAKGTAGTSICETQHQATLGPYTVCTQCKRAGEVPVDGSCVALTDIRAIRSQCAVASSGSIACTRCGPGFFLHAGGCYEMGSSPGTVLCAADADPAIAGVCTSCASGYYSPGTLYPTKESCVLCNNTTNVDGYTGIANCVACSLDEAAKKVVCTQCTDKHVPSEDGLSCVQSCDDSGSESGKCKANSCTAVGGLYCARCALDTEWPINGTCTPQDADYVCEKGEGVCTGCLRGYMLYMGGCYDPTAAPGSSICLKLMTIGGRTYCKRCAIAGGSPINGSCTRNVPVGASCSGGLCATCPENYFLYKRGCYSIAAAPGSDICETLGTGREAGTCRACRRGYRHNKETLMCVPCAVANCASCELDANYCTECVQPYTLTGVGAGAYCTKTCKRIGEGACSWNSCTVMDGTMCSECASGDYVPIDGVCTPYAGSARSLASPCVKDSTKGLCTSCRGNYFLYQGGCYSASEYPGTDICDERNTAVVDGQVVCGRCLVDGEVPLDGTCTKPKDGLICSKGTCSQCGEGMFLFEGACYTKGEAPGTSICGDTVRSTAGCTTCKAGFAPKNGGCVRCSDPNCGACASDPNTCTACLAGYYIQSTSCIACHPACKTCGEAGADKCTECSEGYFATFATSQSGACLSCSDTIGKDAWVGVGGCRLCTAPATPGPAVCQDCLSGYKKLSNGGTHTCHVVCPTGYYETAGSCVQCAVDNCAACTSTACTSCASGHTWDGEQCVPKTCPAQCVCRDQSISCIGCSASAVEVRPSHSGSSRCLLCSDTRANGGWTGVDGCKTCHLADSVGPVVCLECEAGRKKLTLDGVLSCPSACPADGFWTNNSECAPCASGCLRCTSDSACTACSSGYYPTQTAVSAPSHCRPCDDTASRDGFVGIAHCAVCTADITAKTLACSACAEGYGLSGGSCAPCAAAGCARCDGGVCTSCKRGWYLAGDRCLACPSPCTACSSAASCLACADGYFQALPLGGPQECVPCNQTALQGLQVAGVYGCELCRAQAGSGTVLCLRCRDGGLPLENYCGAPPAERRLGPGAIAGISLSVLVLVGGSVGLVFGLVASKRTSQPDGLRPLTA